MVSALWKASSEGRLEDVQELLKTASSVDIDLKDHTGVTPLIEAVKNGHVEVVQALLAHGADPMNASSHGPPQHYTQDPAILELLNSAQAKMMSGAPANENGYFPEASGESYPPPGSYPYYPTLNSSPPEGAVFYPPPQPHADGQAMTAPGPGNLPPPEIARLIPCRYFPACRYGASCLFAHPQGPYLSGPLPPPAQYPPHYDPMSPNYAPNYYPMPAPSFQPPPPNGMNPLPSPPNGVSGPQTSEMMPPPQPFSPSGPPPAPYAAVSPVGSPSPYPQSGPVPMTGPPMNALYHQPPPPPQQQPPMPPAMYNNAPPAPPFAVQPHGAPQYPPVPASVPPVYPDGVIKSPPLNPQQPEPYSAPVPSGPPGPPRDAVGNARRGSIRRGSFGKPPCLFYPAGRCKNGDNCRFPHVMPENVPPHHSFAGGRGGAPRAPRAHINGNGNSIDSRMAALSMRDSRPANGHGPENQAKLDSRDGNRPRFPQGYRNGPNGVPPNNNNRRPPPMKQQRVPNADEFPVLGNLTTPPGKAASVNGYFPNGNGHAGPTAAQVLQAPPPTRKDSVPTANGTSSSSEVGSVKDSETSGTEVVPPASSAPTPAPAPAAPQKLPISFAAVTATGAPEAAAEVSVSA